MIKIVVFMIDLENIFSSPEFEEYFQLREKNPKLGVLRFKPKYGNKVYNFELAYQALKQTDILN